MQDARQLAGRATFCEALDGVNAFVEVKRAYRLGCWRLMLEGVLVSDFSQSGKSWIFGADLQHDSYPNPSRGAGRAS